MRGLLQRWTKSSIILTSKEESVGRNKRSKSRTVSFVTDRLLTWSAITSRSLEPMILSRTMPTYSPSIYEMMIFRNSIWSGTEFYFLWQKSHLMTIWKCTKLKIRESENSRPYWNCTTWKFIRKSQDLMKTMMRRYIEQDIRNKNFGPLWEERRGQESGNKTACTKNSCRLLAMGNQRTVCKRRQLQFPSRCQ